MFPRQQQTASTAGKSENEHRNTGKTKTNIKPRNCRTQHQNKTAYLLTRYASKQSGQDSKPEPKPNKAKAKNELQLRNGSPKQTKKLSATIKAHEDKPKPVAFTLESLT